MKERPILFNTEMVRAILSGRKTQTRRAINKKHLALADTDKNDSSYFYVPDKNGDWLHILDTAIPICQKGDLLYVRETFCIGTFEEDPSPYKEYWHIAQYPDSRTVFYKTDTCDGTYSDPDNETKWTPSIHMPKEYARIWLEVTGVRVERLQDITYDDIGKEGHPEDGPIETFEWWTKLWNSTAKDGYKWGDNPFVFVYEFKRVKHEHAEMEI